MTVREFIAKLTFVAPSVREKLCEGFQDELDNELDDEVKEWILDAMSEFFEEFVKQAYSF